MYDVLLGFLAMYHEEVPVAHFRDSKIRNVAVTQMAMGQWRKTAGGPFPYDLKITWNATAPDIHPETELVPLSKLA